MSHIPVMVEEVMEYLQVKEGGTYIDATAGAGGHLQKMLERVGEKGRVIAIDQNNSAVEYLVTKFEGEKVVKVVWGNYRFIEKIADKYLRHPELDSGSRNKQQKEKDLNSFSFLDSSLRWNDEKKEGLADGILFDLGFSSDEIAEKGRGFSFDDDVSLDMRYAQGDHGEFLCECHTEVVESQESIKSESAEDVVNTYAEKELADIFWKYGDETGSRFFAKKIVEYRDRWHISSAMELAFVIGTARPTFESFQTLVRHAHARQHPVHSASDSNRPRVVLGQPFQNRQDARGRAFHGRLHPATKAFMALRIFVNREFDNIERGLEGALNILKSGGRCVVLSFHSGEDRIVKDFVKKNAEVGRVENLTKHVMKPSREEVVRNRLARSAVMRAFEKS